MKLVKAAILAGGLSSVAFGGPVGPPGGSPILNQNFLQQGATFYVPSGVVTTILKLPFLVPGLCLTIDSGGTVINIPCGVSTGASNLAVNWNGVKQTSPTIAINALSPIIVTPVGANTTAQFSLDPSSVTLFGQNVIKLSSTLQPGSTIYVSSGTFGTQLILPFLTPGECATVDATGKVIGITCGGAAAPYIRSGFSSRFGESVSVFTSSAALDQIFNFQYQSPGITLVTSPGATLTEKGSSFVNVTLSAFTVKKSSPILAVQWKQNSVVIKSSFTPTSTGGVEVYVDTNTRSLTTTYTATADDGTSITTSNGVTFTFIYPFYYGVGGSALTGAQVQALTKLVQAQQNTTTITSPSSQVYYFAYPQAYGVLTSILDTNGFETLSGYTRRSVTLTMLDGSPQSYYIYEFNTPTTQTNFHNTYKF